MKIYLYRHGDYVKKDGGLKELARRIALAEPRKSYKYVFSPDIPRCIETAILLSDKTPTIKADVFNDINRSSNIIQRIEQMFDFVKQLDGDILIVTCSKLISATKLYESKQKIFYSQLPIIPHLEKVVIDL